MDHDMVLIVILLCCKMQVPTHSIASSYEISMHECASIVCFSGGHSGVSDPQIPMIQNIRDANADRDRGQTMFEPEARNVGDASTSNRTDEGHADKQELPNKAVSKGTNELSHPANALTRSHLEGSAFNEKSVGRPAPFRRQSMLKRQGKAR